MSGCVFSLFAVTADAQVLGDRNTRDCSALVEQGMVDGRIEVICGIPSADMVEMMRLAVSGRSEDYSTLLSRLEDLTPAQARLKASSIQSFFEILKEDDVPADQLRDRLAEIAARHLRLQEELKAFRISDPEVQTHLDAASAAFADDPPDHAGARLALAEARALRRAKRDAAKALLEEQSREEARIARSQAELENALLNRIAAARLFQEAEALLPEADVDQRWSDLVAAAAALYDHGRLRGDNAALERAIGIWARVLYLKDRARAPDDWAMTQNNLGNALSTLGDREPGTARLEEAVAAYRAALEERTRERVPLNWAGTTSIRAYTEALIAERTSDPSRLEGVLTGAVEAREDLRNGRHTACAGFADQVVQKIQRIEDEIGK